MQRRNFVLGLGALSAGSAAAVGTGAFSSVFAERDVSVEVADDSEAYLTLQSESEYAEANADGVLELDFSEEVSGGGEHMGEQQIMEFGLREDFGQNPVHDNPDDAVFSIENRGTEDVQITKPRSSAKYFDEDGDLIPEDDYNDEPEGWELLIRLEGKYYEDPHVIAPGERSGVAVRFGVRSNPPENVDATFEIVAEETE